MLSARFFAFSFFLIPFLLVRTAPTPFLGIGDTTSKTATTLVSNTTIDSVFVRPAQFSRIAYCSGAAITSFKCGPPCDELPGVKVLQLGGGTSLLQILVRL
jgi:hypothetical protein